MQFSNLYSAYDRKAGLYLPIFQARNDAEAIRAFTEAVVSSETPISKYPADFDLCSLGSMDLETGEILLEKNSRTILNGMSALLASQAERRRYQQALSPQSDDSALPVA